MKAIKRKLKKPFLASPGQKQHKTRKRNSAARTRDGRSTRLGAYDERADAQRDVILSGNVYDAHAHACAKARGSTFECRDVTERRNSFIFALNALVELQLDTFELCQTITAQVGHLGLLE